MAQQFDSPKTEAELRRIQDKLYQHSKEVFDAGAVRRSRDFWKSCQQKLLS